MWEIFPQKLLSACFLSALMWGQWKPQVTAASCCSSGQWETCTKCMFTHRIYLKCSNQSEGRIGILNQLGERTTIKGFVEVCYFPKDIPTYLFPHAVSGNSQIWHLIGFHPRDHSNIIIFISTNSNHCFYDWPACLQAPLVLDDQVIFCLTVSLDKLPASTLKAKVRNV